MKYLYPLPEALKAQALRLEEFANGGTQCHAELVDGSIYGGLLISNATAIVAMRGHLRLPFAVSAIHRLFQAEGDHTPAERGSWEFFDAWEGATIGDVKR